MSCSWPTTSMTWQLLLLRMRPRALALPATTVWQLSRRTSVMLVGDSTRTLCRARASAALATARQLVGSFLWAKCWTRASLMTAPAPLMINQTELTKMPTLSVNSLDPCAPQIAERRQQRTEAVMETSALAVMTRPNATAMTSTLVTLVPSSA